MKYCDENQNWMSALQLLKDRTYANSRTKISVRKEGFLADFKHNKSNKSLFMIEINEYGMFRLKLQ